MKNNSTLLYSPLKLIFSVLLFVSTTICHGQDLLFGFTQYGGVNNKGVPYQISTSGSGFISYTDFDGHQGEKPGNGAAFIQLYNGNFSAMTELGDQQLDLGTRVNIQPGVGGFLHINGFQFSTDGSGTNPGGRFLDTSEGYLYGLTSLNAEYGGGALFYVPNVAGRGITGALPFDGPTVGKNPKGSLIQGSNGKLYGMTELGGSSDMGVVFVFDNTGQETEFKKILDFNGPTNGSNPTGNLVEASDGKLYGMTKAGGTNGQGVIFSILKDGTGYTKLLDFVGIATGSAPQGSLVQYTDGKLYGLTSAGGNNGYGTIFSITTTGVFTKILDFNGTNGKSPVGDLLVAPNGTVMYGTAYAGGVNDKGVLFKLENGNQFTKLHDYDAAKGSNPVGSLTMIRQRPEFSFPPMPEKTTLSEPFTPAVQSSADMPVYFTSSDESVAVIENNKVKIVGSGGVYITAFQLGNHKYTGQSSKQILSVIKVSQTITFEAIPSKTYGDPNFTVTATSSSGLPVSFTGDIVYMNDNIAQIGQAGTGKIIASQPGNHIYASATPVTQEVQIARASQTVTFQTASVRTCCQNFTLVASSSSQLPIQFATEARDKLSINESYAQPVGVGAVEIVATQPGNTNYLPAEARATVTILKGTQSIQLDFSPPPFTFGDPPSFIGAAASSGLPLTFTSNPPGIAVIEKGSLHFLGPGTTTITASQSGNDLFHPAISMSKTVTVNSPATPPTGNTITWADLTTKLATDAPFNLIASASSGLPVGYTSSNPSVATVSGNLVTIIGPGNTSITASQPGNTTVPAAANVSKVLQVDKEQQGLYLPSLSSVEYGSAPIPLPLTTYQGLPLVYTSSDNNVASVVNYAIIINGTGYVTITASQPGDNKHLPATPVLRSFTVYPRYQSLTFTTPQPKTFGDAPFRLVATASSGLPVTFSSSNTAIASVSGSRVTIKGAGTVTITASQSGYPGHYAVEQSRDLVILKASQHITFPSISSKQFGDAPFLISATSDSKLPVVFINATPGVAKVSGMTVAITGSGKAKIVASQPGNENYLPAENITQEFEVADIGNTYNLVGSAYGGGPNGSGLLFSLDSEGSGFDIFKQFALRTSPTPQSGFIKGNDGRMYGHFNWGGLYNNGRIIRLEADGTGLTVLHNFEHDATGSSPFGNLIQASNGDLYGITRVGGNHSAGTIFRIKTDGTGFTVLKHFDVLSGNTSLGGLVQAGNGKLYGMTQNGAFFGYGSIFSINLDGTDFSVIFHFNNSAPVNSGFFVRGDLIVGLDGFLYGTMMQGGTGLKGTLFKIKTDGSGFTKLLEFNGTNGALPASTLLLGSDGKLYGMTQSGGTNNMGTIFSLNTDGTNYSRLLDFNGTNGSNPAGKLTEGTDGALYGMTISGGANGQGSVFKINKNGTGFHKMADLNGNAHTPVFGPLLESTSGNFFGMTSKGGPANGGAIFKITSADVFTVLEDFPQEETNPLNLIPDVTGEYYYGIAGVGGINSNGSIFRIKASNSQYERIMDMPSGFSVYKIFYMSTGHLWCTGNQYGANIVFRIKTDGTGLQTMIEFDNSIQKGNQALWLLETSNGEIYGTAANGGSNGTGIAFKIKNDGTQFSKVADMPPGVEINPGQFIQGSDGNFYICTTYRSELYRFSTAGSLTKLFTFPEEAGEVPMKIIELNGGGLGIVTRDHGSGGHGSIFTVEKDGAGYAKIFDPKESQGIAPIDMIQSADGWFYVAANYGGTHGEGIVYKVKGDGSSYTKLRDFDRTDGGLPNSLFFLKTPQSFSCGPIQEKKTSDPPFVPETTTTSGAPVRFTSSNPAVAVVENGMIKPMSIGTTTITARLPANANHYEAPGMEQRLLVVTKGNQTITFEPLSPVTIGTSEFELTATSSSELPVTYQSSNPEVATVSGVVVTVNTVGSTTITASQAGDNNFYPAANVLQVLQVTELPRESQTIQFSNPGTKTLGGGPFQLMATASSNLPVTFRSTSDKVAIAGSLVTMLQAGSVMIEANQAGNDDFKEASGLISFCINPEQPFITESGSEPNVTLHSSNSIGNQWYLNGTSIPGATGISLATSSGGTYTVVTTIDGCSSVTSDPAVLIITGVEHFPEIRVTILPNPVDHELNVELEGHFSSPVKLELLDAMGRSMETREVNAAGTSKFDLSSAGKGLYLMKVMLEGKVIVRRVVKQ